MGGTIHAHLLLDCLPQILNQMKTVSHLAGLRCALSGCLCIQAAAISAHDLDRRTLLQPCFCAFDAAVLQNIDDRMTLSTMIVPYREECRQLQSSMPTTRIVSFCMDAGFLCFNCRKIVSSLTSMPSRCIKYSAGRPPILWPIKPTISAIRPVRRI